MDYRSEPILQEYLQFHYCPAEDLLPWKFGPGESAAYLYRLVEEFARPLHPLERALDLGCAVGRATFELTRYSRAVVGVDLSPVFIDGAQRIQREGVVQIRQKVEGCRERILTYRLPSEWDCERCSFEVGDALHLREELGNFDFILAANLLDRVARPQRLLHELARLTRAGGHCLLSSPYTWLEEFTPKSEWLGAFSEDAPGTWPTLLEEMSAAFELVRTADVPFLIRETARKFQWSVAQASLWRRR